MRKVKIAKVIDGMDQPAIAKPVHSMISPQKFAPETYSKSPPYGILYPVSPGLRRLRSRSSAVLVVARQWS